MFFCQKLASFFFAVVKEFECCLVTAPAGPSANMQIFPPHQGNNSKGYQTLESPTGMYTYAPFFSFSMTCLSVVTINQISGKSLFCIRSNVQLFVIVERILLRVQILDKVLCSVLQKDLNSSHQTTGRDTLTSTHTPSTSTWTQTLF